LFVRAFLQQAEDILDIAISDQSNLKDVVIVLDRQGGMRMLDSSGWSLPALCAEFGATAVYKVQKKGEKVRVEGWNGVERCLLQRTPSAAKLFAFPGTGSMAHALLLAPVPVIA
jgi:hypothetical protein